ncbi:hypothetical protein KHA96_04535 [Bacillus sp. FJAT-49711]|uniref:hypothetical protein n=1 Tax=Bacillus sp. FJAT-49711 TaxID=2833585 RepID=UPI001BCA27DF|nr:hypothetical protein [Bacillus sp. FJAT-49711]MBS4217580.1 hypothetical protein [Bacillus sp. FJAT-49711]
MNNHEFEQRVIQNYQNDEEMMILIFAQWCVNHELDPEKVYAQAYPSQASSPALQNAISLTVPKEEAAHISNDTLLNILSIFGNDDLAFVITEIIGKEKRS